MNKWSEIAATREYFVNECNEVNRKVEERSDYMVDEENNMPYPKFDKGLDDFSTLKFPVQNVPSIKNDSIVFVVAHHSHMSTDVNQLNFIEGDQIQLMGESSNGLLKKVLKFLQPKKLFLKYENFQVGNLVKILALLHLAGFLLHMLRLKKEKILII